MKRFPLLPPAVIRWTARLSLAVVAPLLALGGLELVLRWVGFGQDLRFFIPDTKAGFYRTNPAFTSAFTPASFGLRSTAARIAEKKPNGTLRIFVFGESAVMGVPAAEFGFVSQMRELLQARHPEAAIEVYNLGITAINSHVVYSAFCDTLRFAPDLVVIYMGNNEVIGPHGPGAFYSSVMPPLSIIRASVWAKRSRTGQLIARIFSHRSGQPREWEGMKMFTDNTVRASDPRLSAVYANFSANLGDVFETANKAGAKVVLSTVVANLKDFAPFVSLHREGMTTSELGEWKKAFDAGVRAWKLERFDEASAQLSTALRLDPEYAATHFLMGRVAQAKGQLAEARAAYTQALHFDALRFRPDAPINDVIRAEAKKAGSKIEFVDAAFDLGADAKSTGPISGKELLYEHVHFNWDGNYAIARLLASASEKALFPSATNSREWTSSDEVAAALGYNPIAAIRCLNFINGQGSVEPFTNQLTYPDDKRAQKREILSLEKHLIDASTGEISRPRLDAASAIVEHAIEKNPGNAELYRLRLEVDSTKQDFQACLRDLDEISARQISADDGLDVSRARALLGLGRTDEAKTLLAKAVLQPGNSLPALTALVGLHLARNEMPQAKTLMHEQLQNPLAPRSLRNQLAQLYFNEGSFSEASSECLRVLQEDPHDATALALLCQAYASSRQDSLIPETRLRFATAQSKNFQNNSALADYYEAQGDALQTQHFLQAATDCGEGNSTLFLRLAKLQSEQHQPEDMMINLRQAHQLALEEENASAATEIQKLIAFYTARENRERALKR